MTGTDHIRSRPWFRDGMSDAEVRVWEAAEKAAAEAPELNPSDPIWLALQPLVGGCLADQPEREAHEPAA